MEPLSILTALCKPLASHIYNSCLKETAGAPLDNAIKKLKDKSLHTIGFDTDPVKTNHDIQRAFAKAMVQAGRDWLKGFRKRAESHPELSDEREHLIHFCDRVDGYFEALDKATANRKVEFVGVSDDQLLLDLITVVPESFAEPTQWSSVSKDLTSIFENFLNECEGHDLNQHVKTDLEQKSGDNFKFGEQLFLRFNEILKSGNYPEASKAFEFHLFGALRSDLNTIMQELADQNINSEEQQKTNNTLMHTLLDLAQSGELTWTRLADSSEQQRIDIQAIRRDIERALNHLNSIPLDRKLAALGHAPDSFIAMSFEQRETNFIGRQDELAALQNFLEHDKPLQWWQVAGAGGQGKSRLALQLIDTIGSEWHAGFLGNNNLETVDWNTLVCHDKTLVVIDYLAAPGKARLFIKAMIDLHRRLTEKESLGAKLRFLILEREGYDARGPEEGKTISWYTNLRQSELASMNELRHRDTPLQLDELDEQQMVSIANSWREKAHKPTLDEKQAERLIILMRGERASTRAWRPLFAMMIGEHLDAFASHAANDATVFTVLEKTFTTEKENYWGEQKITDGAQNLACLTTMIGGYHHEQQLEALETIQPADTSAESFYGPFELANFTAVSTMLGYHTEPEIMPVYEARQPDLLGEFMVLDSLNQTRARGKTHRARVERLASDAFQLAREDLIAFYIRLREDFSDHPQVKLLFSAAVAKTTPSSTDQSVDEASALSLNLPAYFGFSGILESYINAGASVEAADENGVFPLLYAAQEGHTEVVQALLNKDADVNHTHTESGTFPLLMAAQNGHTEVVQALLNKDADVNRSNTDSGNFPLLMAAQNGHTEVVQALLNKDADVNQTHTENGNFPLLMAAQEGHTEVVQALLNKDADVNQTHTEDGNFPLLVAALNGHTEVVQALLTGAADSNQINRLNGMTALLMASFLGFDSVVESLLTCNIDVDLENPQNNVAPLFIATTEGQFNCCKLLLSKGASCTRKQSKVELSPVDAAIYFRKEEVLQLFALHLGIPSITLVTESEADIASRLEEIEAVLGNRPDE